MIGFDPNVLPAKPNPMQNDVLPSHRDLRLSPNKRGSEWPEAGVRLGLGPPQDHHRGPGRSITFHQDDRHFVEGTEPIRNVKRGPKPGENIFGQVTVANADLVDLLGETTVEEGIRAAILAEDVLNERAVKDGRLVECLHRTPEHQFRLEVILGVSGDGVVQVECECRSSD